MKSPWTFPLVLLAGCVLPMAGAHAGGIAAGRHVFKMRCAICHSPQPGQNRVGPSLFGVVGRTAGSVPHYHYSVANKKSGIVWTDAELNKYLNNPHAVLPGTKMAFPGLKDAQQRQEVISYLNSLK